MKNKALKLAFTFSSLYFLQASFFPWEYIINNNNGIKSFSQKKYSEAEKFFSRAVNSNPENKNIRFNLADSLYKQKKYVESQSIYMELLKTNGLDGSLREKLHYNLGNVFYRLGQQSNPDIFWDNALKEYESALMINPQDKNAKENYEFVKSKMNKDEPPENSHSTNSETEQNKNTTEDKTKKQNFYSNEKSDLSLNDNDKANVSSNETENIMEEMKQEEEGMQTFLNRRAQDNSLKDKSQMIKKDW